MANLHLITGYAGREHITSEDIASFNIALFGAGAYVLDRGDKFGVETISNTQIKIKSGDILFQGRHIRLNRGQKVEINFDIGEQGKNRKDLVVVRYSKDRVSEVEEANLIVIKGTSTTGSAQRPQHTVSDMVNSTATTADMPLYEVSFNGLNIQTPVQVFELLDINGSNKMKAKLEAEISKKVDRVKALNSQNLDTIYKEGNYSCKDCSNRPSDANSQGSLVVYKADTSTDDTSIIDTIQEYLDKNNNIYVRNSIDRSSWTSWKKVGIDENLSGLRTNAKNSLVAAINEVFQLGTNSANKIKSKVSALVGRNVANLTEVATEFEKYDVVELLEEKYKISKKNKKCFIMKNHLINGKEIFNLSNLEKVSLRTKVSNFSNYSNVIPTIENLDSDSIREIKLVDITSGNYMSSSEISNLIGHERYDSIGKIVKTIDDILILFKNYSGGNDFIFSFKKRRKYTQKSIYKLNEKYFTTYDSVYSLDTGTAIRTHRRRKDIDRFIENTNFGIKMVTALSIELVDVLNDTTIRTYNFNGQVEYIKADVLESFNDIDYIYFAERNYGGDSNFNVYKLSVNGELTKIISQKNRETILEDFCISSKIDGNTIVTYRDSIIRVLQLDRILKKVRN